MGQLQSEEKNEEKTTTISYDPALIPSQTRCRSSKRSGIIGSRSKKEKSEARA
jgi:hypothetical protein